MKAIVCSLFCLSVFCVSASAQLEPKQRQKIVKDMEKRFGLKATIEKIEKGKIDSRKLRIVALILKNTSEYYIHNLNGATGNKVYLHKDGHREAVYNRDGKLVKDGTNDGTYNYFHPVKEPLRHFTYDIHPWIEWGATRTDKTSKKQRIRGYMRDLEGGIRKALASETEQGDDQRRKWDRDGQLQALAIYVRVLDQAQSEGLFALFEKDRDSVTDEAIVRILREMEGGFQKLYNEKASSR